MSSQADRCGRAGGGGARARDSSGKSLVLVCRIYRI
jgi:hypothetical protein